MYGFSEIEDINGNMVSLDNISDLSEGDRIIKINDNEINSIEDLKKAINESSGASLNFDIVDVDENERNINVSPIQTGINEYKIGLWVKDAATGIGTMSFILPESNEFVALGHGIVDSDTDYLLEIEDGEITTTNVVSIKKGAARKSRRSKGSGYR